MARANTEEAYRFFVANQAQGLECLSARFIRYRYAPHAHETYVIGAIQSGCATITIRGELRYVPAGSLTLYNPGDTHDGAPCDGGYNYCVTYPSRSLFVELACQIGDSRARFAPFFPEPIVSDQRGASLFLRAFHLLEEPGDLLEADEMMVRAYSYCLTRYARMSAARIGRESSPVARVKELLSARYAQNVRLSELAREARLSRFHLVRAFKRETGLTPHAFLINRRVDVAKHWLRRGATPADVAVAVGFADQAHLTRVFKAHLGFTPGSYRNAIAASQRNVSGKASRSHQGEREYEHGHRLH